MRLDVVEHDGPVTVVALSGRLDVEGVQAIDVVFHAHTAARGLNTVVDLSGVTLIASLGLGMLVAVAKSLRRRNARMVLVAPQGPVRTVLEVTRVTDTIPIVADLREAEQLLAVHAVG